MLLQYVFTMNESCVIEFPSMTKTHETKADPTVIGASVSAPLDTDKAPMVCGISLSACSVAGQLASRARPFSATDRTPGKPKCSEWCNDGPTIPLWDQNPPGDSLSHHLLPLISPSPPTHGHMDAIAMGRRVELVAAYVCLFLSEKYASTCLPYNKTR